MGVQAVKRAHNILNQDKQKIAKDFAPNKKVSLAHNLIILQGARTMTCAPCSAATAACAQRWKRMQDAGMKAISDLDKSLDEFMELMEKKDKQEIPFKQQEALGYVSAIEEAMVRGFPYEVPKQYANLPQLKVRLRHCIAHPSVRSQRLACIALVQAGFAVHIPTCAGMSCKHMPASTLLD